MKIELFCDKCGDELECKAELREDKIELIVLQCETCEEKRCEEQKKK